MSEYSFSNDLNTTPGTTGDTGPILPKDSPASVHQQPLTDRVAQGAHHTIDRLVESATPRIERMEGAVKDAAVQIKDQAQHVREKGDEWANDLRATVRRNPLTAVAVAMAAGALIYRIKR